MEMTHTYSTPRFVVPAEEKGGLWSRLPILHNHFFFTLSKYYEHNKQSLKSWRGRAFILEREKDKKRETGKPLLKIGEKAKR